MVRARHSTPVGHGELLTEPPYETWAGMVDRNAASAAEWAFDVGGMPAAALRRLARRESLAEAGAYSRRMDIQFADVTADPARIVVTGHQPELYHPGVWVKDFLLQRLADEIGAAALDLVVDTDAFDRVELKTPCMGPEVSRCEAVLAVSPEGACFATCPVPAPDEVEAFCAAGAKALSTLPAPAIARHFESFCESLGESIACADDLGQALTGARRRFEAAASTDYLELGVSRQVRTSSFRRFVASLLLDAERFAAIFNAELAAYRTRTGTRSSAQPFPDLAVDEHGVEVPFWVVRDGKRHPARVVNGAQRTLHAGDEVVCVLPQDPEQAAAVLGDMDAILAPRAVTLTLFNRMFVADLFIHGVGGGRYDRVTDAVIRAYFGVEPPPHVVASMTLYLPLGAHVVTEEEVSALEQRLKRLEHNPDQLLDSVEFEDAAERQEADALVAEKCRLVTDIAAAGADKKAIGERIRAVNARLAEMMAPVAEETRRELAALREQRNGAEIFSDRTYPYCLWNPLEVMDKVR